MKKASVFILIAAVFFIFGYSEAGEKKWWEKWDEFPKNDKAPRIMPDMVKKLLLAKEKMVFVYAGYDVEKVLCGSMYLPYTLVPPNADGSKVNLKAFPKDYWIMCY